MADFDRDLTTRGQKAARLIGQYLRDHGPTPDLVLCSPSVRTRGTLAGVVDALAAELPTMFRDELYEASTDGYLDQVKMRGGTARTLLVIGHNPSTEAALARLCHDGSSDLPDAFPTCAIAVIECDIEAWNELAPAACSLSAFVRPRDLGSSS